MYFTDQYLTLFFYLNKFVTDWWLVGPLPDVDSVSLRLSNPIDKRPVEVMYLFQVKCEDRVENPDDNNRKCSEKVRIFMPKYLKCIMIQNIQSENVIEFEIIYLCSSWYLTRIQQLSTKSSFNHRVNLSPFAYSRIDFHLHYWGQYCWPTWKHKS